MSEASHTPPPWAVDTQPQWQVGPDGPEHMVARVAFIRAARFGNANADRVLIEAAPVLLAALERLVGACDRLATEPAYSIPDLVTGVALSKARLAIAQAKGAENELPRHCPD